MRDLCRMYRFSVPCVGYRGYPEWFYVGTEPDRSDTAERGSCADDEGVSGEKKNVVSCFWCTVTVRSFAVPDACYGHMFLPDRRSGLSPLRGSPSSQIPPALNDGDKESSHFVGPSLPQRQQRSSGAKRPRLRTGALPWGFLEHMPITGGTLAGFEQ